jgi:hypothetical protein
MANETLKQEHLERDQLLRQDEQNSKLDYFPFTHGDTIENQRKVLTELQQQEILKTIYLQEYEKK